MAQTGSGDADFIIGPYSYRIAFENARERAGLGVDVVFHSLRHTYISRLAMAGVDIRTVQELAGHKSITMTMRYAHLAPQHKQKALALLENDVTPNLTPIAVAHQ
jgi:integrase